MPFSKITILQGIRNKVST